VSELYVVPTSGGEAKRLTFDQRTIWTLPAWMPDGNEIVFTSSRSGSPSLWRISATGGTPQPVAGSSINGECPSVSLKGNQLAYQQVVHQTDIWGFIPTDMKRQQSKPVLVIGAKGWNVRPQFSPDGKKIAFESSQSGYNEIWMCDSDGSNCGSLTSLRGIAGAPHWSPDGRYIAFEYRPHSYTEVYIAEVGGGQPRLVPTFPDADNGGPSWSRDGQWLYFYSDREHGRFQIYKTRVSGGPPVRVTTNGGIFGVESGDGRFFYFAKWEEPGIWRAPLSGASEETRVLDQPGGGTNWCVWALVKNGIYFIAPGAESKDSIEFFDFASEKKVPIFTLDGRPSDGLAVSSDEKSILFAQDKLHESQVVLVKNFR
jgi:Tol biopolymer transport system component